MKSFLLFFLGSIAMYAQTYEGTIDTYPIFLELDTDYSDDRATAFYFYKSQLKNLDLEGTIHGDKLILFEKFTEMKEQKELFTLTIQEEKIAGTWKNKGRTLQVHLRKTEKDFEAYRSMNLAYVRDSMAIHNKKELVWFTEKHSKKTLFRLGNGFTKSQRELINPKLDTIHAYYAMVGLECSWADIKTEITLLSDHYLSFVVYSSVYCGGAHPNYNIEGYNFDLQNKKELYNLTDVYPDLNHYQLLKRNYENDTDLDSECEYFSVGEGLWEYYSWVFTKKGIEITPSFPHALTPCQIGFLLTYEELVGDTTLDTDKIELQPGDISFYRNNSFYWSKDIDINNDGVLDKVVSNKQYQGDELLLFVDNDNTYELAIKTTNFSEDGGNQIVDIKESEDGFVVITAFPDRGFFEAHHYISLIDDKWILTHTVYKTESGNRDDAFMYVCSVVQNINLNVQESLNMLKFIPDEAERKTVCEKEKL